MGCTSSLLNAQAVSPFSIILARIASVFPNERTSKLAIESLKCRGQPRHSRAGFLNRRPFLASISKLFTDALHFPKRDVLERLGLGHDRADRNHQDVDEPVLDLAGAAWILQRREPLDQALDHGAPPSGSAPAYAVTASVRRQSDFMRLPCADPVE